MKETPATGNSGRRSQRSSAEWGEEIAKWKQSGLSAAAYAAKRDLAVSSLFKWARQLRLAGETPAASKRIAFVPLRVNVAAESAPFELEVTLANGRKVRARGDVDAARFACVLNAVEGGAR